MSAIIQWFLSIPTSWDALAFVISLISLAYTYSANRYSIYLSDFEIEDDRDHQLFSYQITNNSPKALQILSIKMFTNGKEVKILDFSPIDYDEDENELEAQKWDEEHTQSFLFNPVGLNPYRLTQPNTFDPVLIPQFPLTLVPNNQETFSFYVSSKPDQIVVHTDKRIGISKHKTFSVN